MSFKGNVVNDDEAAPTRLVGHRRPIHEVLGGGKVAEILLWRNPKVSAIILLGITLIWFLFEIAQYSFVTFMCHIFITTMLVFFIWCTLAELFKWKMPRVPEIMVDESTIQEAVIEFHARFNQLLSNLLDIACGKDLTTFLMVIGILMILSVLGNYVSSINLLYISYIGLQVLPILYERYEDEVDYFAWEAYQVMKQWYKKFDSYVQGKIPWRPGRDRKTR